MFTFSCDTAITTYMLLCDVQSREHYSACYISAFCTLVIYCMCIVGPASHGLVN